MVNNNDKDIVYDRRIHLGLKSWNKLFTFISNGIFSWYAKGSIHIITADSLQQKSEELQTSKVNKTNIEYINVVRKYRT